MKNVIIFSDKNSPLTFYPPIFVAETYPPLEDPAIGAPITRNAQLVTRNSQLATRTQKFLDHSRAIVYALF